ncbi:unnamed protein product, partial [Mesorhabditis belari]|uniref:Uncharacterized protein n=1 Tax=Mesorhabditis belari TaxID=2138241 RepID=A0AAF3E8M2_9BILA
MARVNDSGGETCDGRIPPDSTTMKLPKVVPPKNSNEERRMKEGHIEDNNEDISYFNFPLLWWSGTFGMISLICMAVAIGGSLYTDYVPTPRQLKRGFIARYGTSVYLCNSTINFAADGLPSLLNLFELNVSGNVFFRVAVVLPMTVRIFQAYAVRNLVLLSSSIEASIPVRLLADLMPTLMMLETAALALFSIITTHFDYEDINRYCKLVFCITACVNMFATAIVTFGHLKESPKQIDAISLMVKIFSAAIFCYVAPQYFHRHQVAIRFPVCHSHLPRTVAYMEYACVVSYLLFHLSQWLDIRQMNFLVYPRTCSGECEPLDPKNFEKGARYEYCRSWEYRQRQLLGLPVLTL